MRRDVILVIAAILAIALLVQPVSAAGSDIGADEGGEDPGPEPPTEYTIYGYVSNISGQERNVPLADVLVELLDADMGVLASTHTDDSGRFEFTYAADSGAAYIHFELTGYMIRTLPETMATVEGSSDKNIVSFDISGVNPDEEGKYALTGDGSSANPVAMALTEGTVYGTVRSSETGRGIEGATVIAQTPEGRQYTATTDADGYFEMMLPYGSYVLTASCNGFSSSEEIAASTSNGTPVRLEISPNDFGIDFLGGLDMPHAMLALGMVLTGAVLLAVLLLIRKSRMPDSGIVVVDDISQYEEEDEIERP